MSVHAWREERERAEIAARKAADRKKADPEMESCVAAYGAHRANGGAMTWAEFQRHWFTKPEAR